MEGRRGRGEKDKRNRSGRALQPSQWPQNFVPICFVVVQRKPNDSKKNQSEGHFGPQESSDFCIDWGGVAVHDGLKKASPAWRNP